MVLISYKLLQAYNIMLLISFDKGAKFERLLWYDYELEEMSG